MTTSDPAVAPAAAAITVVVLAAGRGQRFADSGGTTHKLQALLHGKTVLQHVRDTVAQAGLAVHVVQPTEAGTEGMGDSIAQGIAATPHSAGWLILPGDMPLVQAQTLRAVAHHLLTQPGCDAVQPVWQGQGGHPVAFSARCATALRALQGDQGARAVLQRLRHQGRLHSVAVADPGVVVDIDTVADLAHANRLWAQRTESPMHEQAPI